MTVCMVHRSVQNRQYRDTLPGCFNCRVRAATANSAQQAACLRRFLAWHLVAPFLRGREHNRSLSHYALFRTSRSLLNHAPISDRWRVKLDVSGHMASQWEMPGGDALI
jgi:hypothetical protein